MPPPPDEAIFKPWLAATLAPISDAEPDVLADYVVALLRHGDDRASTIAALTEHLTEFLGDATPQFAARVADALESPDNLPPPGAVTAPRPPPQEAHAIPSLDSEERLPAPGKRKRSLSPGSDSAKAGRLGPAHAPRRSDRANLPDRRRVVPEANPLFASGRLELPPAAAAALEANPAAYAALDAKLPNTICRDFHLRGACGRGAGCKFSHAPLELPALIGIYQRQVVRETRETRGPGPRDQLPRPRRGYDPSQPYPFHAPEGGPGPAQHAHAGYGAYPPGPAAPGGEWQRYGPHPAREYGMGHGNGPGRSATSLVVQGIPPAAASEQVVREHFAQFGPLVDVTVDPLSRKAVVQFASPEHARSAKNDPSVLFGDRFVKVFFQRDRPERPDRGEHGEDAYDGEAHANGGPTRPMRPAMPPRPPLLTPADVKMLMTDARAKQAAVQAQLDEQKRLMQQLTTPGGAAEDRGAVLARLRTLAQEIAQNTARAKEAAEKAAKAQAEKAATPDVPRTRTFRPPFRPGGGHLDLRPTTMRVRLPPGVAVENETQAQVIKHFESFGSIVSVTPAEQGWSIQWANRHEGDKAVWSGGHVPGVGQVHMRWAPAANASATFSSPTPVSGSDGAEGQPEPAPAPEPEAEPDASNADDLYAV